MDTTAKAHGFDGSLVEPDWPPLRFDEVRSILAQIPDAGEPIRIMSASPRPFSAASVVQTDLGQIFVKRHARALRDASALMEEHRFMEHLHINGIGVPRVYATKNGDTAVETPEWTYEVHEIPAGIDLYQDAISWTPFLSVDHAQSVGAMLARMHLAAESYDARPRQPRPLIASFTIFAAENAVSGLADYLVARPVLQNDPAVRQDCAQALALLDPFHQQLKPLLRSLRPLWTHNDLHASNLFWSDSTPRAHATSVIDFGLADRTTAVYDLAQAIERSIIEWLTLMNNPENDGIAIHLDHLWALLDGYERVRPLCNEEARALAPTIALCHAEFALTEAHYFLELLHAPEKARVATHDYLLKHAEWFRGAGNSKLLDPLRRWAETRDCREVRA